MITGRLPRRHRVPVAPGGRAAPRCRRRSNDCVIYRRRHAVYLPSGVLSYLTPATQYRCLRALVGSDVRRCV